MVRPDPAPRGPAERFRWWVALGGGVGHAPVAPGTFGSAPGLLLAVLAGAIGAWVLVGTTLLVVAVGIPAAGDAERRLGGRDPRPVVVDEVAGQMLALWWLPLTPAVVAASFLLFRCFDIFKPFPGRRAERLPGGLGIMMDDLIAGVYANLVLQLVVRWLPGPMGVA